MKTFDLPIANKMETKYDTTITDLSMMSGESINNSSFTGSAVKYLICIEWYFIALFVQRAFLRLYWYQIVGVIYLHKSALYILCYIGFIIL